MSFTFYSAVVPPFQKTLTTLTALLEKAEAYCTEQKIGPKDILESRLVADMHPFAYQVKSAAVHSIGAIEGVRRGQFSPDDTPPGDSFAALTKKLVDANAALAALDPKEVNDFVGKPMRFVIGKYFADYTGDNFLLTFSKPNFYFHATTAYDLLRMKGMAIGKVDYLGRIPLTRT